MKNKEIKKLNGKQILIIGIISLIATGIILSSNWNYFIQNNDNNNNALNSYQISASKNIHIKYKQVNSNIMFQISILKSAVIQNNIMYQNYNNVFKHNISYVRLQRNSIKNKVSIANSSITHEIDILNSMKTIMANHPYNYLKFFQRKNYSLSQIISHKISSQNYQLENIQTHSNNINKSNVSVDNISYQSEEAAIGIGAVSSVVSSSKSLIFSKVHFNYNKLYFFSNRINNLSTVNDGINNISNKNKLTRIRSSNQFISTKKGNKINTNNMYENDKPTIYNRSKLSIKISHNLENFLVYTSISGYGFLVSISFVTIPLILYRKYNNYLDGISNEFINNTQYGILNNGASVPFIDNSNGQVFFKQVKEGEFILSNEEPEDIGIQNAPWTIIYSRNDVDSSFKQRTNLNLYKRNEAPAATSSDNAKQPWLLVSDTGDVEEIRINFNKSIVSHTSPEEENTYDSSINGYTLDQQNILNISLLDESIANSTEIQNKSNAETEKFIWGLFKSKIKNNETTYYQFRAQLIDYAKIIINKDNPDVEGVDKYINAKISDWFNREIIGDVTTDEFDKSGLGSESYVSLMQSMANIGNREVTLEQPLGKTTKYGWFELPSFSGIDESSLSDSQKKFVENILGNINLFLESIPQNEVINEDSSSIIGSQIFSDLWELTAHNSNFLSSIDTTKKTETETVLKSSDEEVSKTEKLNNFFKSIKNPKLAKKHLNTKSINVTMEELEEEAANVAKL